MTKTEKIIYLITAGAIIYFLFSIGFNPDCVRDCFISSDSEVLAPIAAAVFQSRLCAGLFH